VEESVPLRIPRPDADDIVQIWSACVPVGAKLDSIGVASGTPANGAETARPYAATDDAMTFAASALPHGVSFGTITGMSYWPTAVDATPIILNTIAEQSSFTGEAVSLHLAVACNGCGRLHFSAAGLPSGLAIDRKTGSISGTVAKDADHIGPCTVTVTVTDGAASANRTFPWTINRVLYVDGVGA
jgi:hypothetical protein